MEELSRRLSLARRALGTLEAILAEPKTTVVRDAAIQRFEYTFEAVWKAAQRYLRDIEGLELRSPGSVIRGAFSVGVLDGTASRLALEMVSDRNLTVHTYNEAVAEAIYGRLGRYVPLVDRWLTAMETGAKDRAGLP